MNRDRHASLHPLSKVSTCPGVLLLIGSPVRAGGRRSVDGFLTASWATSWFPASATDDEGTGKKKGKFW